MWTDTHSAASSTSVIICKPDGTIKKIRSLSRDSQYPATRYAAQFAPAGNDIYLYGGQTYLQEVRDDLIRLSIKGDRNTEYKMNVVRGAGESPGPRFGHSTTHVPMLDAIVVFGGLNYRERWNFQPLSVDPHLYMYDIPSSTWRKIWLRETATSFRAFHNAVLVDGKLHILGGIDANNLESHVKTCLIIDMTTFTCREIDVPFPTVFL